MKKSFARILQVFLFLTFSLSFAQVKNVNGTVLDETQSPIPGVSVYVEGAQGVVTDFDGKYSIIAEPTQTLVFSYLGYVTQRIQVGQQNSINVTLLEDAEALGEVVVTALGIEKKKDDDISSSTSIKAQSLVDSKEAGLIQSMSGKTSGVKITKNSGDPGSGAFILIRGQNSISGKIEPLIVIDGVPVSNNNVNTTDTSTDGVTEQSRLNDISPEDIESMRILKSAAATAIWGTGAANGAIIITTKRGKLGQASKLKVDVKSSLIVDKINVEFDKQDTFGQGVPWLTGDNSIDGGTWQPNTGFSWGDIIANRSGAADEVVVGNERFESISGNTIYPIETKNSTATFNDSNRDLVFGTGFTFDNSISLTHSGNNSSTYVSYSDWDQQGIIKGRSNYRRQTVKLNNTTKMTEKLTAKLSTNYSKVKSDRIQMGSNLNGLYLGYLRTAPDFDNSDYKGTYFDADNVPTLDSHRSYRNYLGTSAPVYNNPLWTILEQDNPNVVERFIINPELIYEIHPTTKLTSRFGLDYYTDHRENYFPVNSAVAYPNGYFLQDDITEKNETFNTFVTTSHEISENFNFNFILGYMTEKFDYARLSGTSINFTNPSVGDLRIFGNATSDNESPDKYVEETRKSSAYALFSGEFFNQVLMELTGRYERASTLERNVFYPSASLGWKFTELIQPNDIISFGKLRLAYGEVGIEPEPYRAYDIFTPGELLATWGDELNGSQYANPFRLDNTAGNLDLKEERVKEYEVGADLRFFNDRLNLGITYYDRTTEDVILPLDLPSSTGYNEIYKNAAVISNKGIEFDMGLNLVTNKDFNWNLNLNVAQNKNLVEDLAGVEEVFLAGFAGTSSSVVEGYPVGVLYGGRFARDENNKYVLDANGFPTLDETEGVIGDPNPDWTGGIGTQLSYKGVTLSVQFETSQGNDHWEGTSGVLNYFGVSEESANISTAPVDLITYGGDIISAGTQFRGNIEDFGSGPVALNWEWYTAEGGGFGGQAESFVNDASWTKLREVSIGYNVPSKLIKEIGLTNLSFTLTGRNLALWTDIEGFDPEINLTGATRGRGLDYFTNPATKSYAFTMRLGF